MKKLAHWFFSNLILKGSSHCYEKVMEMWRVDIGTFYDLKIPALLFYSMMNEEIVTEAKNW